MGKKGSRKAGEAGASDSVTIADEDLSRESSALASVREHARIRASEGDEDQAAPSFPIIDRTLARLRKAKPSDVGIVAADGPGLIKCEVAPPSIDRLAIILPRIARAASLQGFELVAGDGPAQFKSETEAIAILVAVYIYGGGSSPRRSFRDAKVQRLENMASDIAVGLAVLAAAKTDNASSARRISEGSRRSGSDANWRRASNISKIVELPDLGQS